VLMLGDDARPALGAGLDDEDQIMMRESTQLLRLLDLRARYSKPRTGMPRRLMRFFRPHSESPAAQNKASPVGATVLILTPVKDASGCIDQYCRGIRALTFPHSSISLGFLESDSTDNTYADLERLLPALRKEFRQVGLWKKDFGYRLVQVEDRGAEENQAARRTCLARCRNRLLSHALDDEAWVLWLDVDVVEYPRDIIERLLATGKDIVQPHCVLEYGGRSFDRNAWRDQGRLHLDDMRPEGEFAELDAVGGTMLLVRADVHREGLIFPAFPYGALNPRLRNGAGYPETEGLGLMAQDMGYKCWGMPHLEIRHRKW
jgi:hypothetical protein